MPTSEFERNEAAMLYGLVTAAYIAKKNGYSFHDFMRAVMLSWETEKSDPLWGKPVTVDAIDPVDGRVTD